MANELRNFFRVKRVIVKHPSSPALAAMSQGFAGFLGLEGTEFFYRKGFANYLKVAKGYWKILNRKS